MPPQSSNVSTPASTALHLDEAQKALQEIEKLKVDLDSVWKLTKKTSRTQGWSGHSRRDIEEILERFGGKIKYLEDNREYIKSHIDAFDFDEVMLTEEVEILTKQIQGLKASISRNQQVHPDTLTAHDYYVKSFKEVLDKAAQYPVLASVLNTQGSNCNTEELEGRWLAIMTLIEKQETKIYELMNDAESKALAAATSHMDQRITALTTNLNADIINVQDRLKSVDDKFKCLRDETSSIMTQCEDQIGKIKESVQKEVEVLHAHRGLWDNEKIELETGLKATQDELAEESNKARISREEKDEIQEELNKAEILVKDLQEQDRYAQRERKEQKEEYEARIEELATAASEQERKTRTEVTTLQRNYDSLEQTSRTTADRLRAGRNGFRNQYVATCIRLDDQLWESSIAEVDLCTELQSRENDLEDQEWESSLVEVELCVELQLQETRLVEQQREASIAERKLRSQIDSDRVKHKQQRREASDTEKRLRDRLAARDTELTAARTVEQELRDTLKARETELIEARGVEQELRDNLRAQGTELTEASTTEKRLRDKVAAQATKLAARRRMASITQQRLHNQIKAQETQLEDQDWEVSIFEVALCVDLQALEAKVTDEQQKTSAVVKKLRDELNLWRAAGELHIRSLETERQELHESDKDASFLTKSTTSQDSSAFMLTMASAKRIEHLFKSLVTDYKAMVRKLTDLAASTQASLDSTTKMHTDLQTKYNIIAEESEERLTEANLAKAKAIDYELLHQKSSDTVTELSQTIKDKDLSLARLGSQLEDAKEKMKSDAKSLEMSVANADWREERWKNLRTITISKCVSLESQVKEQDAKITTISQEKENAATAGASKIKALEDDALRIRMSHSQLSDSFEKYKRKVQGLNLPRPQFWDKIRDRIRLQDVTVRGLLCALDRHLQQTEEQNTRHAEIETRLKAQVDQLTLDMTTIRDDHDRLRSSSSREKEEHKAAFQESIRKTKELEEKIESLQDEKATLMTETATEKEDVESKFRCLEIDRLENAQRYLVALSKTKFPEASLTEEILTEFKRLESANLVFGEARGDVRAQVNYWYGLEVSSVITLWLACQFGLQSNAGCLTQLQLNGSTKDWKEALPWLISICNRLLDPRFQSDTSAQQVCMGMQLLLTLCRLSRNFESQPLQECCAGNISRLSTYDLVLNSQLLRSLYDHVKQFFDIDEYRSCGESILEAMRMPPLITSKVDATEGHYYLDSSNSLLRNVTLIWDIETDLKCLIDDIGSVTETMLIFQNQDIEMVWHIFKDRQITLHLRPAIRIPESWQSFLLEGDCGDGANSWPVKWTRHIPLHIHGIKARADSSP
ncbi:hypothetical protein MMC18_005966 [Xylographa bjoerkii]|nr:hypothetical protein [Xylographa bjoerkii]